MPYSHTSVTKTLISTSTNDTFYMVDWDTIDEAEKKHNECFHIDLPYSNVHEI